ncbi:MAG: histidine kinase dimerization/phosphoacceptor domain -containing protein [Balneolaceae bacterium]
MSNSSGSPDLYGDTELLLELIGKINSSLDLNQLLKEIIDAAIQITSSEACTVYLIDQTTNELILSIPGGPAGDKLTGKRFPRTEGIAGWVAEHKETLILSDVAADPRFRGDFDPGQFVTKTMLCTPLKERSGRVIGVLQAMNKKGSDGYSEADIPLFRALADQAGIAITNANLLREKETLLSEIHHRVKNNLAVVSGMLQIQALEEEDPSVFEKLMECVARISSMATVHEELFQSDSFSKLDFSKNLKSVTENTLRTLKPDATIPLAVQTEPVELSINQAIPCSLMVNEVITVILSESLMEAGEILKVTLHQQAGGDEISVGIHYTGASIQPWLQNEREESAKYRMLDILARQLEATCTVESENNRSEVTIRFKKSDKKGTGSHHF